MNELKDQYNLPLSVPGIEYNSNIEDTNCLVFEGYVPENKISPGDNIKDNYSFSIAGTVKFRDISYITQVVCSYGGKMIRNSSQVSLNINLEILKMDNPMYIPIIKKTIDNFKLEIIDGTVNMAQN